MRLARSLSPLVDLVFPPRCPSCGDALAAQDGLCAACWSELVIPGEPACETCGRPFPDAVREAKRCAPCLAKPPKHAGIVAATAYGDVSRDLVLAFKRGNRIALAPMMARLIAARLPESLDGWLVVPVPLHRWRIWQRGFNQSAVLAREIVAKRGGELCLDALVRTKATPTLGGLGAKERRKTLKGAIAARTSRAARIAGRDVLLVDDVLTSGATSDACVAALGKAGAARVRIACFARVLS